jgi:hypothetical protein
MRKKAQGTSAATLIVIIAALIVLYILFIPPAERQKLLEGENATATTATNNTTSEGIPKVLLLEYPGSITYQLEDKKDYSDFPTVYLSAATNSKVIGEANTIFVESSDFSKKIETLRFDIDNVDDVDRLYVTFKSKERSGVLVMKINDQVFYENVLKTTAVSPITIPKTGLINGENVIEFSVNRPGLAFWSTNRHILENVQVIVDMKQLQNLVGTVTFYVPEQEAANVNEARISFFPDCTMGTVGKLTIKINDKLVYSALPDCGMGKPISFDPTIIISGQNKIEFSTDKGTYVLDSIRISTKFKEQLNPTYYFKINQTVFDYISDGTYDINLTIDFADQTQLKVADIVVNQEYFPISQRDSAYSLDISNYVKVGNNAVKIVPASNLDIIDLKVELKE